MSKMVFDQNDMTIGDLEDFEDATGQSITEAFKGKPKRDEEGNLVRDENGRPVEDVDMSAKSLKAIIWLVKRREDPEFTLEDSRHVRITELDVIMPAADEADGVEAAAGPKAVQ